jgi:hypothetical protein
VRLVVRSAKVRSLLSSAAALFVLLLPGFALADWPKLPLPPQDWLPGAAREIPRSTSASRDTPVLEAAYGPRAQSNLGLELGVRRFRFDDFSVRFGAHFLVALEDHASASGFPFVATQFWRAIYGSNVAFSATRLAHEWLGPAGAIEISLGFAREGDHMDADFAQKHPRFEVAPRVGDIPTDPEREYMSHDLAMRVSPFEDFEIVFRIQNRIYLRGAVLYAPGGEAIARYRGSRYIHPILAVFGERLVVDHNANQARDGAFGRILLGAALPGIIGEITPFGSLDGGNGKGMLLNRRDLRISAGVRYSPW